MTHLRITFSARLLAAIGLLAFFAVIFANIEPAVAAKYICEVSAKFVCGSDTGCQKNPIGVWNEIDTEQLTLARCDRKGCDRYKAIFATSGAFINISLPQNGMLAKISLIDSKFVEVATVMTAVFVSHGQCRQE